MISTALLLTAIASEHLKKQNVNRNTKVSVMKTAHGHYVNGSGNTKEQDYAVDVVNLMLGPNTDDNLKWARESNIPEKYVGMFYQCDIDSKSPFEPEKKIDLIVRTGFFL